MPPRNLNTALLVRHLPVRELGQGMSQGADHSIEERQFEVAILLKRDLDLKVLAGELDGPQEGEV